MPTRFEEILQLVHHPDADTLREFDHPPRSLKRWAGILTAKAWAGDDLACFFSDAESGAERYVLIFKRVQAYMASLGGGDMRHASLGAVYELDVFVMPHHPPIIDRAEQVRAFT